MGLAAEGRRGSCSATRMASKNNPTGYFHSSNSTVLLLARCTCAPFLLALYDLRSRPMGFRLQSAYRGLWIDQLFLVVYNRTRWPRAPAVSYK